MKTNTLLLCTVTLSLGACSSYGPHTGSGPRYTPRPYVAQQNYTAENHSEDRMDIKSYNEYEQREQCQHYRKVPRHFNGGCATDDQVVIAQNMTTHTGLLPVVQTYTILFDYDKSNIRSNENATLDQIMHDINKYDPRQVTVTGYTDSAGDVDYNQKLSRKREQTISAALMQRGITNQSLDREARGEYEQAVQTSDGVRNQENRRVVIDFRR